MHGEKKDKLFECLRSIPRDSRNRTLIFTGEKITCDYIAGVLSLTKDLVRRPSFTRFANDES